MVVSGKRWALGLLGWVSALGASVGVAGAQVASFQTIDFPSDWEQVIPRSIDDNGEFLVGTYRLAGGSPARIFVYETGGAFRTVLLPQGDGVGRVFISGNGRYLLGTASTNGNERPFRYDLRTSAFEWIGPENSSYQANATNRDGTILVGAGPNGGRTEGWVARPGQAIQWLGVLTGAGTLSGLFSVSSSGSIAVGTYTEGINSVGIRWLDGVSGFSALSPFSVSETYEAGVVSADGRHIIGATYGPSTYRLVRWIDGNPDLLIPDSLNPIPWDARSKYDGSIVMLYSNRNWGVVRPGQTPLQVPIENYLADDLGVGANFTDWTLSEQLFYSPDGTTLIGDAIDGNFDERWWMVRIQNQEPTSLAPNATSVVGSRPMTFTVQISGAAGVFGERIRLRSNNSNLQVPGDVVVAPGQTQATFEVTTSEVASPVTVTVTARLRNRETTALLQLNPLRATGLSFIPSPVRGGINSTGTVTLNAPAPRNVSVALASPSNRVLVPVSVTVPTGQTSATFTATTRPVASETTVNVTATVGSTPAFTGPITVVPPALLSVRTGHSAILGTTPTTGTVTLTGAAPPGGLLVTLGSNNAAAAVPASVRVPENATTASFTITTRAVASDTAVRVTATLFGQGRFATLTVKPPSLSNFTLSAATTTGGTAITGTVTLNGPAPAGGLPVALTSSNPGVATVPATAVVPEGLRSRTFAITAQQVNAVSTADITARRGSGSLVRRVTVSPLNLVSITATPNPVVGGALVNLTVTLSGPAPAGGWRVTLSSSNASVLRPPTTVIVPAGQRSLSVAVRTVRPAAGVRVQVEATEPGSSARVNVQVNR